MLNKLQRHLTLFYLITISIILTFVIFFLYLLTSYLLDEQKKQNFEYLFHSTISYLESQALITNTWISEQEISKEAILYLEDNGVPFSYAASWNSYEQRQQLMKQLKELAMADGFYFKDQISASHPIESSVYKIKDQNGIPYYGAIANLPTSNGYQLFILCQSLKNYMDYKIRIILLFIFIGTVSISVLYFVCRKLVHLSLQPIEENQKKQTEFIASASHELRSPLSVISTNVQALMLDSSEKEHFLSIIAKECIHMKQLINDMLLLASSDAKSWTIQREKIDTDTFFIELYDMYAPLCAERKHTFSLELSDEPLCPVFADKQRLLQVLGILIDNAISYSDPGTTIQVKPFIHSKKNTLTILVIDHGVGISDADKKQIFDRFFRSDRSRNSEQHYGLGLSIAKELVSLHKGSLSLFDTEQGGTTFCIEIPVSPKHL